MNQNQKSHQPMDKDQKSTHSSAQAVNGAKPAGGGKGLAHEHQDGQRSIKPKAESSIARERDAAHKA